MKKLLSFIIVICVLISCSNQSTEPDNNDKKNNQLEIITEGTQTVNYGLKIKLIYPLYIGIIKLV